LEPERELALEEQLELALPGPELALGEQLELALPGLELVSYLVSLQTSRNLLNLYRLGRFLWPSYGHGLRAVAIKGFVWALPRGQIPALLGRFSACSPD
jgi:hypothetical protein